MDSDANIVRNVTAWSSDVQIPSTIVHAIAIVVSIFRLLHRWNLSRLWWDDNWAILALLCDILCLTSIWLKTPPTSSNSQQKMNVGGNWLLSLTLTAVLWFARLSILCSIVRIANPTPILRRTAYGVGVLFLAMGAGLLAQKVLICLNNHCWFTPSVAVAQLVTDIVSDLILVVAPIRFLRDVKLLRDRRILILSAFSASILITCVTILHSILLFEQTTNATLIIGHVKAALALFLCNALVLATLIYRLCQKGGASGPNATPHSTRDDVELTSVIELPSKLSVPTCPSVPNKENAPSFTKARTHNRSGELGLDPSQIPMSSICRPTTSSLH